MVAIEQKRRLRFIYNSRTRVVEPQCYGVGTRGTQLLRVHQSGAERHERRLRDQHDLCAVVAAVQLTEEGTAQTERLFDELCGKT
ncbi:hypothetical protein [Ramlibacter sp.]|uniref:hypothetical protein n=1 Tax=Ramlibacter sp. TaxID=1917967 RepID=UPI00263A10A7|nr:hypothetical protein [Ramlibacter sp.]